MTKILRKILFDTVLVVILLHTFIPHPHSDEMTEKEHIDLHNNSNSLYGILRIALHENNDENLDNLKIAEYHIETKTTKKNTYPNAVIKNNNQSVIEKTGTVKIINWNFDDLNKLFIVKLNGVRGSPFIV